MFTRRAKAGSSSGSR